ncbi:MAG: arginine--tRNA ligase [Eubacteriales bacterium]|nr:arginine--tRNA ligase [Eubacteriales bacterium]
MKDQKKELAAAIAGALENFEEDKVAQLIETPPDSAMGDYAFPCFKLAAVYHKAPQKIAEELAEKLRGNGAFADVKNVNAYVNFFMNRADVGGSVIGDVIAEGDDYGKSDVGGGRPVIVEFSSPNIAKPFHIGHIRSTVIGASLAKIYKALGYDVIRINHLGDYGTQFGKMIVAYRKWGNEEDVKREPIKTLLSYYVKFHEEAENDPSLDDEARATFTKLENGEKEEVEIWQWFREESLKEFSRVYDMLGIEFDSYAGESFYSDKMPRVEKMLEDKGLLQESEGAQIVDLSDYDMPPALIKKKDGSTLYITRDITAAIYRKETYDFYRNIYVVASQQNLHFKQLFKIIELMGYDWANQCIHVPFGMVSLEDGTMSTRKGKVVFLIDVLNKSVEKTREIIAEKNVPEELLDKTAHDVGIGAVIFQELSNNRIKDYTFSWDKVLNFDGETGPYVQYTHARCSSVLRKAGREADELLAGNITPDMSKLTGDVVYELIKAIGRFPDVVLEAGEKYEPSIITRHITDIAELFNKFYHDEHILVEDRDERLAKLAVTAATKQTIKNGLALLGIAAPDRM